MRVKIQHETTYTYDGPVRGGIQLLRMTPRSSDVQFVRKWRVSIDADARLDKGEDAFGNITHLVFMEAPYEVLRILVEGEVDTTEANGVVSGSVERLSERLFLRESALTAPTPAIRVFAREAVAAEGGDALAGLHRINADLFRIMRFDTGSTTSSTTAGDAFAARAGVCQDFAHIFIAAARAAGIPARYVNGYFLRTDTTDQDAGHAWAEAYLTGIGWIAFDPAHGVCATERHVRVAVGSDSHDAAPIRGARSGGQKETLAVAISVSERKPGVSQGQSQSQSQSMHSGRLGQTQQQ